MADDLLDGEPPVIDPYEVLDIDREATADQIKSAYRKAALKTHPDKVGEEKKDEAKEKFQNIAFAYAVLSDPARRKRYDETGSTSEAIVDSDGFDWGDFYRAQFKDAISGDAIREFAAKYKGSLEERDDVLAAYADFEGDMDGIYETVMLSDVLEDDKRFRKIIDDAIKRKHIRAYDKYTKETRKSKQARIRKARGEATEADAMARQLGVYERLELQKKKRDSEASLAAVIRSNQASRANAFDQIIEKYAGKKRSAMDMEPDISDEQFEALRAQIVMNKRMKR